jgi:hypothetical protein
MDIEKRTDFFTVTVTTGQHNIEHPIVNES